jgi:hypothetical protein
MTVELKADAKDAASDMGWLAAGLGTGSAVSAYVAVALAVPTAGTGTAVAGALSASLALSGAGVGLIALALSDLAGDPPRDDFHLVSRFKSRLIELPRAELDVDKVWNEYIRAELEMAGAVGALITSFERLDGARLVLRKGGSNADLLARHITTQRRMIRHNAAAIRQRIQTLRKLRNRVNAAWRTYVQQLGSSTLVIPADQAEAVAVRLWNEILPTLRSALPNNEQLAKMKSFLPPSPVPRSLQIPDELLSDRWNITMESFEKRLAAFAGERVAAPKRHELDAQTPNPR